MIQLSQYDPRWAKVTLGKTYCTLAKYGCTTTGLSVISDYFGNFITPAVLAKELFYIEKDPKPENIGKIIWSSVPKVTNFRLVERQYKPNFESLNDILRYPNPDWAVLLEVENGAHWVVATKKFPFMNEYFIIDPLGGKKRTTFVYKNITGAAIFTRK